MILGKELESVGTWIQIDGMTYPLLATGGYDDDELKGCHVCDIEVGGDWMTNLSDDDRKTVEAVLAWNS
jgi:hypothetical protein